MELSNLHEVIDVYGVWLVNDEETIKLLKTPTQKWIDENTELPIITPPTEAERISSLEDAIMMLMM